MSKIINIVILLHIICFSFVTCKVVNPADLFNDDHIKILSASNFTAALDKYDYILCVYYAPWCPFCLELDKKFIEAAHAAAGYPPISETLFAKVNCLYEREYCNIRHIHECPTVRYYRHGQELLYTGVKSTEGIVTFLNTYVVDHPRIREPKSRDQAEIKYRDQQL